ncbi:stage II sporulation protein R [Jeotgalibacillus aurantiacus]|uniref:stage II sporulation protein R n=1 Tax=Jeotgalibacillus aurantiacus TaxID=2763266 RepID=UPI001D0A7471|nr:stage II sporulation protein R [Jeotgalibacillus aurantiacus]
MLYKTIILVIILSFTVVIKAHASEEDVRLRVIGHSDSIYDQEVKQALFYEVTADLKRRFGNQKLTKIGMTEFLQKEVNVLEEEYRDALYEIGGTDELEVSFEPHTFPDGQTFQTLVVKIGEAEGANWWCALFPDLCGQILLVDEKKSEEESACESDLSPEKSLSNKDIKVESFILNWVSGTWNRLTEK